ncbi:radical SAM family heme chaperone HemW [Thermoflexus sp.]|uniref:radical SAM family heme chaperone HemW n=1 Tax=Thermoflexus sp. TaxID=1969742 RepID=UPI0017CC7084|nr:radical SAM family heme chaperone HemW [Thermoflexus sp.]
MEFPEALAVYIHIPFCRWRCSYCDFNIYAGMQRWFAPYIEALGKEIRRFGERAGRPLARTIYIGGGTPSLLPLPLLARLFEALHEAFRIPPGIEITMEANPRGLSVAYLEGVRQLGVNRISFGVQSAHPGELRLLRRDHTFEEACAHIAMARAAGFANLNVDLIYGLPGQPLHRWQETLEAVLALRPEHLSAYALIVEERTALHRWIREGRVPAPDPDRAAEMYEWTRDRLAEAGYRHYEISNWARPGHESRHNLVYWRYEPYIGFGAGAHSFIDGRRWMNVLHPKIYIHRIEAEESLIAEEEPLDPRTQMAEMIILGLRLVEEGVEDARFRARFGHGIVEVYGAVIEGLEELGLVQWNGARLRLTGRGLLLGNEVFWRFL